MSPVLTRFHKSRQPVVALAFGCSLLCSPLVPSATAQDATATEPVVTPVNVMAGIIFAQLEAGTMTAKEAWDSGALRLEDVGNRLEQHGLVRDEKKPKLRDTLLDILATHGEAWWLPNPAHTPPTDARLRVPNRPLGQQVRMAVADQLDFRGHPLALDLYLDVLREAAADPKTRSVMEVSPVLHLSRYYARRGDHKQAAATIEAGANLSHTAFWHDAWRIEAARQYFLLGDFAKGKELYAQATRSGSGWLKGVAQWDQADMLIAQGRHADARELLATGVDGAGAEFVRVGIYALRSLSFYKEGDFDKASEYAQEALNWYEKSGGKPEKGIEVQAERAQDILKWIEKWNGRTLVAEPATLTLKAPVPPANAEPLKLKFTLWTATADAVSVTSELPTVKISVDQEAAQDMYAFSRRVTVTIAPDAMVKPFETMLTVSSEAAPDDRLRIPLKVSP